MTSLTESLSVQDLLNVGSASAREGLRRTAPRLEKKPRPCRDFAENEPSALVEAQESGKFHGTDSSAPISDIRISMLASPQGASVLNIWIEILERMAKGGHFTLLVCSRSNSIDPPTHREEQAQSHSLW